MGFSKKFKKLAKKVGKSPLLGAALSFVPGGGVITTALSAINKAGSKASLRGMAAEFAPELLTPLTETARTIAAAAGGDQAAVAQAIPAARRLKQLKQQVRQAVQAQEPELAIELAETDDIAAAEAEDDGLEMGDYTLVDAIVALDASGGRSCVCQYS